MVKNPRSLSKPGFGSIDTPKLLIDVNAGHGSNAYYIYFKLKMATYWWIRMFYNLFKLLLSDIDFGRFVLAHKVVYAGSEAFKLVLS